MNPGLKLFLILTISFEISLIPNLTTNLIIISICLIYLLFKSISLKKILLLLIIPLFAATVVFITIYYFTPNHNLYHATILFTVFTPMYSQAQYLPKQLVFFLWLALQNKILNYQANLPMVPQLHSMLFPKSTLKLIVFVQSEICDIITYLLFANFIL